MMSLVSHTPSPFRTNIAVCGKFHLFNYVPYIRRAGLLNRFYYSHPRQVEAEPHAEYVRMPLKEYLIQGHGRAFGDFLAETMNPLYAAVWRRSVLARWDRADIFHYVVLGHSLPLVRRARAERSLILADVVSTHPEHRRLQMKREAEKWGVRRSYDKIPGHERHVDAEIAGSDLILAPSHHVAQTYTDRFPDAAVVVIPYATNLQRFFPPDIMRTTQGPLRVMIVGRIGLRKGQLYVLDAISRMPKGTVELTLVGTIDPAIAGQLAKYRHIFTHITRVANEDLVRLHHQHDVFMLTSVEEGLAVSICEAMGSGMAIACTVETGANEIITDKVDGYILPSGSVEGVQEFLDFAITNRAKLLEIGAKAAENARQLGTWEIYANRLIDAYAALTASVAAPREMLG